MKRTVKSMFENRPKTLELEGTWTLVDVTNTPARVDVLCYQKAGLLVALRHFQQSGCMEFVLTTANGAHILQRGVSPGADFTTTLARHIRDARKTADKKREELDERIKYQRSVDFALRAP